jgi:N-acetylmuramoyl-L-alanine amidase
MMAMLRSLFLVAILLPVAAFANAPYFLSIPAKSGDGITVLLKRYDLHRHTCNVEKFLELNNLKRNDNLLAGKNYKLPIYIYSYNGKSIRSTIGIDDMTVAKRIAEYNKTILDRKLRKQDYTSSKILWVPYHELHCESAAPAETTSDPTPTVLAEAVPSGATMLMEPLFGSAYEKVIVKSKKLKGKVYYISAGHGGPDPGALAKIGQQQICEDEYAYDVALRLARNLMENGATVHIIVQDPNDGIRNGDILMCDHDEKSIGWETIPLNQLARLRQRTDAINALYAKHVKEGVKEQYLVCLHVDSQSENMRQDVYFYHFEHSKTGKKLAQNVKKVFEEKYSKYRANGEYGGTVSTRNLYMLRMPHPTTLYVELANIKNPFDRKRILPASNRQALANWLYEGLATVK